MVETFKCLMMWQTDTVFYSRGYLLKKYIEYEPCGDEDPFCLQVRVLKFIFGLLVSYTFTSSVFKYAVFWLKYFYAVPTSRKFVSFGFFSISIEYDIFCLPWTCLFHPRDCKLVNNIKLFRSLSIKTFAVLILIRCDMLVLALHSLEPLILFRRHFL